MYTNKFKLQKAHAYPGKEKLKRFNNHKSQAGLQYQYKLLIGIIYYYVSILCNDKQKSIYNMERNGASPAKRLEVGRIYILSPKTRMGQDHLTCTDDL